MKFKSKVVASIIAATLTLALLPLDGAGAAEITKPKRRHSAHVYAGPREGVAVMRPEGRALYRYRAYDAFGPLYPADYGPYDPYRPYFYRYPYGAEPFPYGFWWW